MCGLRSEATQKKLLTEKDLTFKKVLDVAQNNEMASVHGKQLQSPKTARDQEKHVCKVTSARSQDSCLGKHLLCCGKPDHKKAQCKYKDYTCNNCDETGQLRRVCSKPPSGKPIKTSKRKSGVQVVRNVCFWQQKLNTSVSRWMQKVYTRYQRRFG